MRCAINEVRRVLVPGGKAVYVVGENAIRGTYVRNSRIVSEVAQLCSVKAKDDSVRLAGTGTVVTST